ncbi:primosomal protein N' [Massilia sp. Root351]|jgi:primosomal protein N' (replication factor Y)|uniref:primosomal protein N' n=1 Tax=Massilia sp. Root351 TaxID=1736522 RepID=UPI000709D07C|nr:primosomal protein N' [Massilia sp. Root351]KQV89906.1 primosomal protein N' [Massilia sp. Root351]
MAQCILRIALDTPLNAVFDYRWQYEAGVGGDGARPQVGQLALVPFARREVMGLIVGLAEHSEVPADKLKDALAVRHQLAPLSAQWLALAGFAADYYQRPLGEVALPGLPKNLRVLTTVALDRAIKKLGKLEDSHDHTPLNMPQLNPEQQAAADYIGGAQGYQPALLYGVTGSGKTEVYLQACAQVLEREPQGQILIMVPEINLTPQLEGNIRARFPGVMLATLHSSLSEGERMLHWLAAHQGQARIVLGTRLAILSSLPKLKLIVIDEEHDPSYKQQEGLRYSARDLAVWRAWQLKIPIVLGSATPSLESWHHAQGGRYRLLALRERAVKAAVLPAVKLIDMERDKPRDGLTGALVAALKLRMARGEQSLLFLNRRGYAPVICCESCGWISDCTRCTSFMVLHKPEHRLRCHHCSLEMRIPHHCPTCGNVDLQPVGRGTQRVEEGLQALFPEARILRIDADSTRKKGSAQEAFDTVHRGEVDILIGTQMVAKGHDFKKLTLVGIMNPDTALFSQDYRASERLFAQLMQVAGRAGRAAQTEGGSAAEVLIQTRYTQHPLYSAVVHHDYDHFASALLDERKQAGLPPYLFQALLRAEAPELATAIEFLEIARDCVLHPGITINDPIPMTMTRIHNVDRAQLLVECASRPNLQVFLKEWMDTLRSLKTRVKWSLEVDPLDI